MMPDAQSSPVPGQAARLQTGATHRILLKRGIVLTLDRALGDFETAHVLIEGAKIAAVGRNLRAEAQPIDASHMIVMPGSGARDCPLDHKIGTLTPGKNADSILPRTDAINVMPVNNAAGAVVTLMDTSNVGTVFISGKLMKQRRPAGGRRSGANPAGGGGFAGSRPQPRRRARQSIGCGVRRRNLSASLGSSGSR
jgi:hypothetical protein